MEDVSDEDAPMPDVRLLTLKDTMKNKQTTSTATPAPAKKQPIDLNGRGKLMLEVAGREGMTLQEFTDVVREKYPVGGPNWFAKQFKKAQARIAKQAAKTAKPAPAPAPVASAPVETKPTRKTKKTVAKA